MLRPVGWVVVAGTLVAAGALAVVRLGDPQARRLVELVALVPLGLPLAALGAVAALVVLLASRHRLLPGLALGAALGLLGLHAWWLAPLYAGGATAAEPGSVVVMSLNFEVGDPGDLAATSREQHVDVLVLLEVTAARLDAVRSAGVMRRLPHVAGVEAGDASGTVVLSRFPVVATAPLYGGADSLAVRLDVPGPDRITVVAVHTRPPYQPEEWRDDHDRTLASLSRLPGDDVLLAGDFNATLAHAPMRRLLDRGFRDAADQADGGWSPTWPAGGHERRLGVVVPAFAAIDHVLTAPGLVVTGAETLDVAGADHRAVLVSVSRAARP